MMAYLCAGRALTRVMTKMANGPISQAPGIEAMQTTYRNQRQPTLPRDNPEHRFVGLQYCRVQCY